MVLASLLLALTAPVWNFDGHRLICEIAWLELTPTARQRVERILATDTSATTRQDWCVWADVVRRLPAYQHTSTAHYVNLPMGAAGFDLERDCGNTYCAVEAIRDMAAILGDAAATSGKRLEALKFLGHFVGDIHQPLHAGYGHDRGGNDARVRWNGQETNLHRVWDGELLMQLGLGVADAARLRDAIQPIDRRSWADLSPATWVDESYQLVVHQVYDGTEGGRLAPDYVAWNRHTVERQIMKAGFRLGAMLNMLLGD